MARLRNFLSLLLTQSSLCATFATAASASRSTCGPDLSSLQTFSYKPRIFILTDILNEPDDSMSMVRYLLYANEFDTRGICACTSTWLRNATHPEQIEIIVNAYGQVVDNLNNHVHPNFTYQPADYFLPLITSGPAIYGKAALKQSASEGALRLVSALQESDEPLYVPAWGGVNTLAQALLHMSQTLSADDFAAQRAKLRVYTISDQDDTGMWIRSNYPDIHYIVSLHRWNDYGRAAWTGMNTGADSDAVDNTKVLNPWLDANIRLGPLGAEYPQVVYGMEGDTPSYIWLVQNGLGHPEHIEWGGWGGRYGRMQALAGADAAAPDDFQYDGNLFADSLDTALASDGVTSIKSNKATIWRWRDAMQDDFAARMQWTLTSNFSEAAHPPVVSINGSTGLDPITIQANSTGAGYVLDATNTYDPDQPCTGGSELDYTWLLYTDVTGSSSDLFPGEIGMQPLMNLTTPSLVNNTAGFANVTYGPVVKITTPPAVMNAQTGTPMMDIHLVLQVTNTAGDHPIRRYKRVIFTYD